MLVLVRLVLITLRAVCAPCPAGQLLEGQRQGAAAKASGRALERHLL